MHPTHSIPLWRRWRRRCREGGIGRWKNAKIGKHPYECLTPASRKGVSQRAAELARTFTETHSWIGKYRSAHTIGMPYKMRKSRKSEFQSNFLSGSVLWNYQDILSTFLSKVSVLDRRPCELKHYFSFRGVRSISFIFVSHPASSGKNLSFIVFQTGWCDRQAVLGRTLWVSLHLWPLSGQNQICRTWQHLGWEVVCSVLPIFHISQRIWAYFHCL